MNVNKTKTATRRGRLAAALLAGATIGVAMTATTFATASAENQHHYWVAYDVATGNYGAAASSDPALVLKDTVMGGCAKNGGTNCRAVAIPASHGSCFALVATSQVFEVEGAATKQDARLAALQRLITRGVPAGTPISSRAWCQYPDGAWVEVDKLPPPQGQTKLGPTVTAGPTADTFGQMRVTVTERAGEAGDCTYNATPQAGTGFGAIPDPGFSFHLNAKEVRTFTRPGFDIVRPNATWDIVVDCGGGKVGRPDQAPVF